MSEPASTARREAEQSFAAGLHCAESTLMALARLQGLDSPLLPRVASAFGSGMSRTCGQCGALTGAIMGLSLAMGRPSKSESVEPVYAAAARLVRAFESEFGHRDCHALLGCDIATAEGQAKFRAEKLRKRCTEFTGRAAEIAAQILLEDAAK